MDTTYNRDQHGYNGVYIYIICIVVLLFEKTI